PCGRGSPRSGGVRGSSEWNETPHPARCARHPLPQGERVAPSPWLRSELKVRMPEIVCLSPVDGREVVRRAASSAAEIEAAVAAARKAQDEWKRVTVAE